MKTSLLVMLWLFCSLWSASFAFSADARPRHLVILIHGVFGNKTHFGHMKPALEANLPKVQGQYDYEIVNYEYQTFHDEYRTYDFAKNLGKFIHEHFSRTRPIEPQDKISLIMHSQGGLVGAIWVFRSFLDESEPEYFPQYVGHLDSFITLGTPFWGAKMATFGRMLMRRLPFQRELAKRVPLAKAQVAEMAFGSDTINTFRERIASGQYDEVLNKMKSQVRALNIGGVVSEFNVLARHVTGGRIFEDDTAVPLPCSRLDFIYLRSIKKNYDEGDFMGATSFTETDLADFRTVNALHVNPLDLFLRLERSVIGMAQVRRSAIANPNDKRNEIFLGVLEHLSGKRASLEDKLIADVRGFLFDLDVELPEAYPFAEQVRVDFKLGGNEPVQLHGKKVLYSSGRANGFQIRDHARFYFTGSVLPKNENTPKLFAEISGPELKRRLVEVKVKPSFTTYLRVNLEPKIGAKFCDAERLLSGE